MALLYRFFLVEGSPTEIDYREKVGTLILSSLLEDLGSIQTTKNGTSLEIEDALKARRFREREILERSRVSPSS